MRPRIYTGLRKGELFGLRKIDVDLAARTLTARRSYDRDTTKGGHADTIPIAAELLPYLEAAIAAPPSDLVFPGANGEMPSENAQVEITLRRAGICLGHEHKCRAEGCAHVERHPDADIRRCPTHDHRMWPVGIVRPIRFHDLRHTTGSLLAMRGVDTPALQRILRHRDPRITMSTYVHLTPGYLRDEIDRLTFEEKKPDPAPDTTRLLPAPSTPVSDSIDALVDLQEGPLFGVERDIGLEPTTFSLETRGEVVAGGRGCKWAERVVGGRAMESRDRRGWVGNGDGLLPACYASRPKSYDDRARGATKWPHDQQHGTGEGDSVLLRER
jgi:hypothetical protein